LDKNKNHVLGFIPFIPCITVKCVSKKLYLTGMKGIQGITSKPKQPLLDKDKNHVFGFIPFIPFIPVKCVFIFILGDTWCAEYMETLLLLTLY